MCDNAGFDATDVLNKLRQKHALTSGIFIFITGQLLNAGIVPVLIRFCFRCAGEGALYGVDINSGGITDTYASFVWEPSVVKVSLKLVCLLDRRTPRLLRTILHDNFTVSHQSDIQLLFQK